MKSQTCNNVTHSGGFGFKDHSTVEQEAHNNVIKSLYN